MIIKIFHSRFLILFLFVHIFSIKISYASICSFIKRVDPDTNEQRIVAVADRMEVNYFQLPGLQAEWDKQGMADYEKNLNAEETAIGRRLIDKHYLPKIRIVPGKNGKTFSVCLVGDAQLGVEFDKLLSRKKGRIGSAKSIAKLLDQSARIAAKRRKQPLLAQKLMVTDADEIYEMEIGRNRKLHNGIKVRQGAKIRKLEGNVQSVGWYPAYMKGLLKEHYGGEKPLPIGLDHLKANLPEAHQLAAKFHQEPNPISKSFVAWDLGQSGSTYFEHDASGEEEAMKRHDKTGWQIAKRLKNEGLASEGLFKQWQRALEKSPKAKAAWHKSFAELKMAEAKMNPRGNVPVPIPK